MVIGFCLNHLGYAVIKDGLVAVFSAISSTGEVQPAVAQAGTVLKEHLVEVHVADYPAEPVAGHLFIRYREVGSLAEDML